MTFRPSSLVTRAETGAGMPVAIPTSSMVMALRLDVVGLVDRVGAVDEREFTLRCDAGPDLLKSVDR